MILNEYLTYAGKSFNEFSTFYDGSLTFSKPSKDVEFFSVAGRNGDLSISNNRFANIEITIPCFIRDNFRVNYNALIDFLSGVEGYQKLEFSEQHDTFRLAQFVSSVEPTTGAFLRYGSFELVFNCKPQTFLKEGELEITVTNGMVLRNPTTKIAKPLIMVKGTGNIAINENAISLSTNTGTTYIDCDIQDVYEGNINRNGNVTILNGFPYLKEGNNGIAFTGFSSVKIIPRWWRL